VSATDGNFFKLIPLAAGANGQRSQTPTPRWSGLLAEKLRVVVPLKIIFTSKLTFAQFRRFGLTQHPGWHP
jgi:hypothetical protein